MPWFIGEYWNKFCNRGFHLSVINPNKEPVVEDISEEVQKVHVRPIDKRLLVWSGKYKRIEDVPDRLSRTTISKCHSVCRVRACNYVIAFTVIASFYFVFKGKKDAKEGLTIEKLSQQWHEQYNKDFEKNKEVNKS